jgi:hypothetical protein
VGSSDEDGSSRMSCASWSEQGTRAKLIELRRVALVGLDTGLVAESSFFLLLGPSLVDQLSEVVPKRAHDARTAELDAMRRRT